MILSDFTDSVRSLFRQIPRVLKNPRYLISGKVRREMRYEEVRGISDSRERFARIYDSRVWRGSESVSGAGSSLDATREIRRQLPGIVAKYGVKRFLDAPCGDFHWMKEVVREMPHLHYIGGDIVERLIARNRRKFGTEKIHFEHLDISDDVLPAVDLMMVRDCLFHLSYADISRFLANLARADIGLLLTTTNVIEGQQIDNRDIESGDFRAIDLFSEPFGFPRDCLEAFEDNDVSVVGKRMCLFRVDALIDYLAVNSTLYRSTTRGLSTSCEKTTGPSS